MPNFANPFQGNVNRKLTKEELIQAVRLDIAGELEAIYLYDAHVQATDDEVAKMVISDIRDEEKAHVGELMTLLRYLILLKQNISFPVKAKLRKCLKALV